MSKPDNHIELGAIRDIFHRLGLSYSEMADGAKVLSSYVSMGIPEFNEALRQIEDFYRNKILEALLAENKLYEDWFNGDDNVHIEHFIARRINHITAQFNSRGKDNE